MTRLPSQYGGQFATPVADVGLIINDGHRYVPSDQAKSLCIIIPIFLGVPDLACLRFNVPDLAYPTKRSLKRSCLLIANMLTRLLAPFGRLCIDLDHLKVSVPDLAHLQKMAMMIRRNSA